MSNSNMSDSNSNSNSPPPLPSHEQQVDLLYRTTAFLDAGLVVVPRAWWAGWMLLSAEMLAWRIALEASRSTATEVAP